MAIKLSEGAIAHLTQLLEAEDVSIIKPNSNTKELGELLKSIGGSNKSNGYHFEEDPRDTLEQIIQTGEYEADGFSGFFLDPTTRMSYDFKRQKLNLSTNVWEDDGSFSNPFKYISYEPILKLTAHVESLITSKFHTIDVGLKKPISKSDYQYVCEFKSTCYPKTLDLALWIAVQRLMKKSNHITIEEYAKNIEECCERLAETVKVRNQ